MFWLCQPSVSSPDGFTPRVSPAMATSGTSCLSCWQGSGLLALGILQLSHTFVQSSRSFGWHKCTLAFHGCKRVLFILQLLGKQQEYVSQISCVRAMCNRWTELCDFVLADGCRAVQDTSSFPSADIQLLSSGNFSLCLQELLWLQQYLSSGLFRPLAQNVVCTK